MKNETKSGCPDAGAVENVQKGVFKAQTGDISSKRIFENRILAAQFLRDYSGIAELKDVRPEEIETTELRYHLFNETEMVSDSVMRVLRTKKEGEIPIYIIPLIEHKSTVDYNVSVQLFYYIACIWRDWEKEMKRQGIDCRKKDFRYPMVFPIVYYEGVNSWTASLHLIDRVRPVEELVQYTPDFKYHVVSTHSYSNEELLAKNNEMSLVMLLEKIQTSGDVASLQGLDPKDIDSIIADTGAEVIDIIAGIVQSLCRRMNVPEEEAREYIEKIRGEKNMGYLFENMEKMDIQAERKKTAEEKKRADEAEKSADEEKKRADEAEIRLKQEREKNIGAAISVAHQITSDRAKAKREISEKFELDEKAAEDAFKKYWR